MGKKDEYKEKLASGREFDNSWKRGCPEAFRLNQVIEGWQEALRRMHVGDAYIRSYSGLLHIDI